MAIHQELTVPATPKEVYDVLTTSDLFSKMTGGQTAEISTEPGGEASMFNGEIKARNVELVPGKRVVQAWRAKSWPEGHYSIVRFELDQADGGTRVVFDQAGHPDGTEDMLSGGWQKMYWSPMTALVSAKQ